MSYRVRFSATLRRSLRDLPGHWRALAKQRLVALADNPRPTDAKELTGHPGYYRLWIGAHYRLVWQVIDEEQLVDILYLGPKVPDLYARLNLERS